MWWKIIPKDLWLYVAIALLSWAYYLVRCDVTKYKERSETLEATISDLNQEIEYTKVRLNDSIEVYQAQVKNLSMTQANIEARYKQLLAASKTKPKDVSSVTDITSVMQSRDTVISVVNTFGGLTAQLVDPYVLIGVEVLPDKNTIINYEVRDSLTVLNVQKKHSWLFGLIKWNEHKETRVINHNPKARIASLQTIDIIQ